MGLESTTSNVMAGCETGAGQKQNAWLLLFKQLVPCCLMEQRPPQQDPDVSSDFYAFNNKLLQKLLQNVETTDS